ncbi:glutathione S-transferase family protein [Pseudoalteromonas denitrificans]|uniref:Glutathione S-transferase n=1 Tax=Pseudoalteromonas denitrificans DSM 6059 TaxID=1123010 RepID=A0A1I1LQE7_9GAMM|nr:glutathione S-transferase family protein [Pseudoalteromonas denitrificans]SFC75176.1 glutathione S-transferase [Pseudoalteromonas denitrificans DSM 6059]
MNANINKQTVHIFGLERSNFVRTVMLICEEKNIPYTFGFEYKNKSVAFKSDQHFKLHPYGKIPVLLHNDFELSETASICRYLDNNFEGNSVQFDEAKKSAYHDAFCAIASIDIDKAILRHFLIEFAFPKGENGEVRLDVAKAALPEVRNALNVISNELASHNGILNNEQLSIADALVAPMIHYLTTLPEGFNLVPEFPRITAYLADLFKHESCQKILIKKAK